MVLCRHHGGECSFYYWICTVLFLWSTNWSKEKCNEWTIRIRWLNLGSSFPNAWRVTIIYGHNIFRYILLENWSTQVFVSRHISDAVCSLTKIDHLRKLVRVQKTKTGANKGSNLSYPGKCCLNAQDIKEDYWQFLKPQIENHINQLKP